MKIDVYIDQRSPQVFKRYAKITNGTGSVSLVNAGLWVTQGHFLCKRRVGAAVVSRQWECCLVCGLKAELWRASIHSDLVTRLWSSSSSLPAQSGRNQPLQAPRKGAGQEVTSSYCRSTWEFCSSPERSHFLLGRNLSRKPQAQRDRYLRSSHIGRKR